MNTFITLLLVNFLLSVTCSVVAIAIFSRPLSVLLRLLVAEQMVMVWRRFLKFAILVVGVAGGVNVYSLERYLDSPQAEAVTIDLSRWLLEGVGAVLDSFQSIAFMLLVVLLASLVAYVILRAVDRRGPHPDASAAQPGPAISPPPDSS